MCIVLYLVITVLLIKFSEEKSLQFSGYPEENRNVVGALADRLFEGDMLASPEIRKIAATGGDVSMTTRTKRGSTNSAVVPIWPDGVIPYAIDPSLQNITSLIKKAMSDWEKGSCISFLPRTNENVYLNIIASFPGCFSYVGYTNISRYPDAYLPLKLTLNLGSGCKTLRLILHELGHSIGFWHEQSRPDRDNYVEILWNNIMPGKENAFMKYDKQIDSLGFPYDMDSIMHYGPKAFAKPNTNKNTIRSLIPNKTLRVNYKISAIDRQQLNKLYNCS